MGCNFCWELFFFEFICGKCIEYLGRGCLGYFGVGGKGVGVECGNGVEETKRIVILLFMGIVVGFDFIVIDVLG